MFGRSPSPVYNSRPEIIGDVIAASSSAHENLSDFTLSSSTARLRRPFGESNLFFISTPSSFAEMSIVPPTRWAMTAAFFDLPAPRPSGEVITKAGREPPGPPQKSVAKSPE